ncbi:uncharacterized protein KQ657_005072 [Scheffersomyces spartinae]|uniref:ADF-H domain-containing protein n=1 Tax=Scheffersomyces spartinae TaxID=45513 RepID=A0A9P8AII1_9ASCO|nr:uncharacterized protein KQ657_005072 [Scheffersomyces spartinae]KAG7193874.1 hypothetical protein KQ657_005072 [Scheffersomyces spartinae]
MATPLYTFSPETLSDLRKFRFASARANTPQALIYIIDKTSYEVKREDDDNIIDSIEELVDGLPDNSPRFVVLSYPITEADGRMKSPLVMIYWIPPTCNNEGRMLYAGAVELVRDKAGVSKLIKIEEEDEFEDIESLLQ